MNVVIFGATGMVGQGVLRECLLDPDVQLVQTVGRTPTGLQHPKLREIVRSDLLDYTEIESALRGFDACFFCLGVSSTGMSESEYERVTYTVTMAAAQTLSRLNPGMTFICVSGAGTDSSEKGRIMWARMKGKTENALLRLSFKAAYMLRPGAIQPVHGARSKTPAYRVIYTLAESVLPLLLLVFPRHILTTEELGRAMLLVAKSGAQNNSREFRHQRLPDVACLASVAQENEKNSFCTPLHRFSQLKREISIDDKNEKNYLHARLNRGRKRFAAQFIEGARSLTADAPSFLRLTNTRSVGQPSARRPTRRSYAWFSAAVRSQCQSLDQT